MVVDARLEEIADDFTEVCLKHRPVMIFSLDVEIEEYRHSDRSYCIVFCRANNFIGLTIYYR